MIVYSKMKHPYQMYEKVNTHLALLGVHESYTVEVRKYISLTVYAKH